MPELETAVAAGVSLPPLNLLQDALRETTHTLVASIVTPGGTAPGWGDLEWRIAEAAVAIQGIAALLASRVRWRGPDRWEAFLADQRLHTRLRKERALALIERIDRQARQAGIAVVVLKGPVLYRIGLYPGDERSMSDVDLLVRPGDEAAAVAMMPALGYRRGLAKSRHRTFEPANTGPSVRFGEHVGNPLKIELHTRIAEALPLRETDITAQIFPRGAAPGVNAYASLASVMSHLLLHAAGSIRGRALRFMQLHDIALLARRMAGTDWSELLHEGDGDAWWAYAPLALTHRYYPEAIPALVLETAALGCPWLLRRTARRHTVMDVSWAKLRIQAFPGIEWARSGGDALGYMKSRVFPDREALAQLRYNAVNQAYAAAVPWFGLSHGRRILRWLIANPPRVQGIYPIQLALGIRS